MNPAEIARRMETDAVAFYRGAAAKCSSEAGRKMFLSIAEDEERHIRMVEALIKGLKIDEASLNPMDKIKTVFEELKDEMQERIAASSDDTEALQIAMKMEQEGYDFYEKSASEATDESVKTLFRRLHDEETKHYAIFANTLAFLKDTGNWFMWDERGVIEG